MFLPKFPTAALILTLGVLAAGRAADPAPAFTPDRNRVPRDVAERYAVIKPRPDELKWKEIPWLTDLDEGLRQAKKEKRPLLIWLSGDEPLERC
jgi:hypothetical protein